MNTLINVVLKMMRKLHILIKSNCFSTVSKFSICCMCFVLFSLLKLRCRAWQLDVDLRMFVMCENQKKTKKCTKTLLSSLNFNGSDNFGHTFDIQSDTLISRLTRKLLGDGYYFSIIMNTLNVANKYDYVACFLRRKVTKFTK